MSGEGVKELVEGAGLGGISFYNNRIILVAIGWTI
jgi:hypothetical protein